MKSQFKDKNFNYEIANNQTDFTIEAVNAVSHDLLLAIVLVAVVMLFFLHSIRNAVIVMLAIPTSLVATFIMMYAAGFTLNLMTLLAMSLVIGILVDDSIVVLENIYRYMEHGVKRKRASLIGRNRCIHRTFHHFGGRGGVCADCTYIGHRWTASCARLRWW